MQCASLRRLAKAGWPADTNKRFIRVGKGEFVHAPGLVLRGPRVGFLGLTSPHAHARFLEAFRRGLRDRGYIDGESIWVEYRWAEGQYDRLPQLATDLIRDKVDLVVRKAPLPPNARSPPFPSWPFP
jgi:hypothetical protein